MAKAPAMRAWGQKDPDQEIEKEILGKEIASILKARKMTQIEAAYLAGDAPSQMSLVVSGKLRGFSVERLLRIVARLGRDVDITIKPTPGNRTGKIRISRKS